MLCFWVCLRTVRTHHVFLNVLWHFGTFISLTFWDLSYFPLFGVTRKRSYDTCTRIIHIRGCFRKAFRKVFWTTFRSAPKIYPSDAARVKKSCGALKAPLRRSAPRCSHVPMKDTNDMNELNELAVQSFFILWYKCTNIKSYQNYQKYKTWFMGRIKNTI